MPGAFVFAPDFAVRRQDDGLVICRLSGRLVSSGKTEPVVVVAVGRVVPVAVRRAQVATVVVPTAAAQNAVRACATVTLSENGSCVNHRPQDRVETAILEELR